MLPRLAIGTPGRKGHGRRLCRIQTVLTLSSFEHRPPMSATELLEAANSLLRHCTNQRVTERTLRYYVSMRLVPRPDGPPKLARYGFRHLVFLVAIKILQHSGYDLIQVREEIQPLLAERSDEAFRQFADKVNLWIMKARPGERPIGLDWPPFPPSAERTGESLFDLDPRSMVDPLIRHSRASAYGRLSGPSDNVLYEIRRLNLELEQVKEIIAGYSPEVNEDLAYAIRELRRAVEDLREEVRKLREQQQPAEGDPQNSE